MSLPPGPDNCYYALHVSRILSSYRRWTGRDLVPFGGTLEEQARLLWEAPFVVVSGGTEPDPIFNYGNGAALRRFEMTWEEFIALPSRLSAEPAHQEERARLLAQVAETGYIDDYGGVRISKTGRRFRIEGATVWNVVDEEAAFIGQAAMFGRWTEL